jgi:hypothetical protein
MPDLPEANQPAHRFDHVVRGFSARLIDYKHSVKWRRERLSGHDSVTGYFPPAKQLPAFEMWYWFVLGEEFSIGAAQSARLTHGISKTANREIGVPRSY